MSGTIKEKNHDWAYFRPLNGLNGSEPEAFTQPFDYVPHPWVLAAAKDLQQRIEEEVSHNFGMGHGADGLGKMMGVLVVRDKNNSIGYLAAYSGRLDDGNQHQGYVPPIFDILDDAGFYRREEDQISAINREVIRLEEEETYLMARKELSRAEEESIRCLHSLKEKHRLAKQQRKIVRSQIQNGSEDNATEKLLLLDQQSARDHYEWKDANRHWKQKIENARLCLEQASDKINKLKEERRRRSAALQQQLFVHYTFLNAEGKIKSLAEIFNVAGNVTPPSGAGECAAPKLLHFAYLHGYKPIAMGEFWWGKTPPSEVRQHGRFYPACKSKCEPILGHMLQGLKVAPRKNREHPEITVVREDEHLAIIRKPHGLLSVPGKADLDSVAAQAKRLWPEAEGPMMVHRLDMDTSGLMIITKTRQAYHHLQLQFLHHRVQKTYLALLEGEVATKKGVIDLPLRVDLDDRPRQLVCEEHGKPAVTHYKVIAHINGKTRIYFYPMTGRTHQLRVHAAHNRGLGCPIAGDDLYGNPADRLHLQAIGLEFEHPISGERISIWGKEEF